MSDIAIRVENISKRYRLGEREPYKLLREVVSRAAAAPLGWMRRNGQPGAGDSTGYFWALDNVSFEIKQGQAVGIIGRNGAGKSTLLKILSRITRPTRGQAQIYGRVGSLLEVGTGFHPELTGRENIYLNGAILGMKRIEIERKFDEIVAFAEIEKFLDTPVKRYSSGMYVRLAFAVAAHLEPEILLVDEVLAVGDAQFQRKCLGKMGEVTKTGRCVLFVSHNMSAVQQLCNKAILIKCGEIVRSGPPDNVIPDYLSDAFNMNSGEYDLSNHPARMSKFKPLIRKAILYNHHGVSTNSFFPDECIFIDIEINLQSKIKEPRIAIAIEDSYGRRITTLASYFNQTLPDISEYCRARCYLSELDLGSGRYLLSFSIATKADGLLDSIDNAAWFDVIWNNNYGNGEVYNSVYGPVIRSSKWEIVENSK